MRVRWSAISPLLLLAACAAGEPKRGDEPADTPTPATPAATPAISAAHQLLDEYTAALASVASTGASDHLVGLVFDHQARLGVIERDGKLGAEFARRYGRLLLTSLSVTAPVPSDADPAAVAARLHAYAIEVQGPGAAPIDAHGGLAAIGPVLADEVLNLHMLLDGATDREQARAKHPGGAPRP